MATIFECDDVMSTEHVFVPGEIAVWQNLGEEDARCNGQECIVVSRLHWSGEIEDRWTGECEAGFGYDVRDEEGEWFAYFYELRKRKPPQTPITRAVLDEVTA